MARLEANFSNKVDALGFEFLFNREPLSVDDMDKVLGVLRDHTAEIGHGSGKKTYLNLRMPFSEQDDLQRVFESAVDLAQFACIVSGVYLGTCEQLTAAAFTIGYDGRGEKLAPVDTVMQLTDAYNQYVTSRIS